MKNRILILLLSFGMFSAGFAQGPPEKGQRIQAMKIGFMTKKLKLTPDEAKVFWPVYEQFQEQHKAIKKGMRGEAKEARENFDNLSDADAKTMLDKFLNAKQAELDLMKKYAEQFSNVLPIKKVPMVYVAEEQFTRHLLKELKKHDGQQRNGAPSKGQMEHRGKDMDRGR